MAVIEFKRREAAADKGPPRATLTIRDDGTIQVIVHCPTTPYERHRLYLAVRESLREIYYRFRGFR